MLRAWLLAIGVFLIVGGQRAAAQPLALHVGSNTARISRDECLHKAVAAMIRENLIRAEIDKDGQAWGVNEHTLVKVHAVPYRDGVHVIVIVAGKDAKDAERLRNALRSHICDEPYDATAPKQHQAADASRKPCGVHMRLGLEQRNIIPTVRFFIPATTIVLEKQGLGTNPGGPALMFGGNAQTCVAVFAVPGPNEVNVQIGVAAASADDKEAERLSSVIRSGVVRVLFE